MKDYFLRLFDYDRYANHLIADAIRQAGNPQKSVQLMAHLLAAQQVWLSRCNIELATGGALWPDWQAASLKAIIDASHKNWNSFLMTLNDNGFDMLIVYKNSKGYAFENKLIDVLGHLINHGTHHRAQIGQQLKFGGAEQLPPTDYIFYLRTQNQAAG